MEESTRGELKRLLDECLLSKIICGAVKEDPEDVKRFSILYTLSGAKDIDISANLEIVCNLVNSTDFYEKEIIKTSYLIPGKLVQSNINS